MQTAILHKEPVLTVKRARVILGTSAQALSDDALVRIISKTEQLTDTVIKIIIGSKIQSSIVNVNNQEHTETKS